MVLAAPRLVDQPATGRLHVASEPILGARSVTRGDAVALLDAVEFDREALGIAYVSTGPRDGNFR